MEAVGWLAWTAAGAACGIVTGLVPGFHVNTLAALGATLLAADPSVAFALVAAGTVHTFVGILPATYLGVPDDDAPVAMLPAHRMLAEGRAPTAVRLSLQASLLAAIAACIALPLYAEALRSERFLSLVDGATFWLIGALVTYLLAGELRHGLVAVGRALLVTALAGLIGWWGIGIALEGLGPVPASPLLPILAGLFGVPGLLAALAHGRPVPPQDASTRPRRLLPHVLRGVGASAWTALLPGVTSATATAVAARRSDDPRPTLATLSAIDTAHAILALGVLWILLRGRTGLALAVQEMVPIQPWSEGSLPTGLSWVLATILLAAAVAVVAGRLLDGPFRLLATRIRPRRLTIAALLLVVALVGSLAGPLGLVVLACCTPVGMLPLLWGLRRIHLTACLTVPVLLRALP